MRVGDVISHVDGDPIGGLEMSTVVSLLKGPKGTPVDVRIVRPGVDEPIDIAIIRDEIRNFTLSNAFLIRDDIAYIKIDSFAGTTSDELRQALEILGADAVSGLILDLRGNPGGLMQEAIDVSELFLDKGLDVLETRGRNPGSEHIYESRREDSGYPGALIVVINRQSASASEIVAGAIQDHDRGLVIGDTSFGKGLVQSVFSLGGGSGLALTTQKWYTPSGRLIQRDYSRISEFDYYNPSVVIEPSIDDIHYSDLGRVVYGGGGVTPDVAVAARELNPVEERLGESFVFYTFARGQRPATPAAPDQFEVTGPMLDEFLRHAQERGIDLTPGELAANREFVSNRIRYEVIYNVSGVSEAARILIDDDPQIQRAIELIPEAGRLAARARSEASGQTRD
jgi:carboxyl-terminal processing protease